MKKINKLIKGFDPMIYHIGNYDIDLEEVDSERNDIATLINIMMDAKASDKDLARAFRYSRVLAHKHFLDYQEAKADFGIEELQEKYKNITENEEKKMKKLDVKGFVKSHKKALIITGATVGTLVVGGVVANQLGLTDKLVNMVVKTKEIAEVVEGEQ